MEIMDSSMEIQSPHLSRAQNHHNLGRPIMIRHPRQYFGRQYSRRNSANYSDMSASHLKGNPTCDEKQTSKLGDQCSSGSGHHTEKRDKSYRRPEKVGPSSLAVGIVTPNVVKMVCGICQKLLKRKPYFLDNTISSAGVSVVAVLVCGHVYHANCLEQRTCIEHIQDPSCPLCIGILSQANVSG